MFAASEADPAGQDQADERAALGARLRALLDRVVRTDATAEELRAFGAEIDDLAALVEAAASVGQRELRPGAIRHDMSLVGGIAHPVGPQLHLTATDTGVGGTVTVGTVFEGAPGLVHGGILSLLFDHAFGFAAVTSGHGAMTVSLTVRYKAPTPIAVPLAVAARLDRVDGRKLFLSGEISVNGSVTASAEAVFVRLTGDNVARIFPDHAG